MRRPQRPGILRLLTGALSFGFHDIEKASMTVTRQVTLRNYSGRSIHYSVTPTFRFPDDEASGAVELKAPGSIIVPAHGDVTFTVGAKIHTANLPPWVLDSGANGNNPDALTAVEFDGYINLVDPSNADNDIHLAWQVLPRAAGDVEINPTRRNVYNVHNKGAGDVLVESYSLLDISGDLPEGGPGEGSPRLTCATPAMPPSRCPPASAAPTTPS